MLPDAIRTQLIRRKFYGSLIIWSSALFTTQDSMTPFDGPPVVAQNVNTALARR